MRIGVNARFLLKQKMEGFGWYTYETMSRITRNHPEHQFIFFFDRPWDKKFIFSDNIEPVVLFPPARHPILQTIWFNWSIKRALKKQDCAVFLSPDGYLSLTSKVPQLAVIHDLNFEHHPEDLPPFTARFLQKKFPLFAKKAAQICTVSQYSKEDIARVYEIPEKNIDVAYNGSAAIFRPVKESIKIEVQRKYTQSEPFVLFVGAIHRRKNIRRLVEAFLQLKQKKKIPHHLLVVGEPMWKSQAIEIEKSSQKFIHFTGHLPLAELAQIMGSAACLSFVSYFEGFGIPIVEAMQSGTPVLLGNRTSLPEIGGDAAIYCDPFSVSSIQEGLEKILIDQVLRKELIEKGLQRAKIYSWDFTARDLWNSLEKIFPKK